MSIGFSKDFYTIKLLDSERKSDKCHFPVGECCRQRKSIERTEELDISVSGTADVWRRRGVCGGGFRTGGTQDAITNH